MANGAAIAVVLDVDGTLVDSNDAHARAWVEAFAEEGIAVPFDRVRRAIGMGGDKLLPAVSGISEESDAGRRVSARRAELFKTRYLPHLQPCRGARDLVARLASDGFALAVASSAKADELQPLLETAGVADLVPTRTSSDDADRSKPDPDIVKAALKRTGVDRARAVMVGDTPYDVEAAARTAIAIVGLKCGGWTRADLCGAVEVYEDPADVLRQYDESIFYRLRHAPPQLERA
jgi:HAD superfamily hydrolase (TIGR01509 family)